MATTNDARAIITPDSFTVAPELLGLPLAKPWRRACAFLLDLLPVGVLANAGIFPFLIFLAPFLAWRALAFLKPASFAGRTAWTITRIAFGIVAIVIVAQVGRALRRNGDDSPQANVNVADSIAGVMQNAQMDEGARSLAERVVELEQENDELEARLEQREDGNGLGRWVAQIADVVGIGFGWGALYFTIFLVLGKGQTPGKRLLGIRVIRLDARPIGWWLAFERFGSYFASVSTGLLGFLQIFWDRNRQALHDKAVETVVIRVLPAVTPAAPSHASPLARR